MEQMGGGWGGARADKKALESGAGVGVGQINEKTRDEKDCGDSSEI